jgi:hypothetical protein
MRTKRFIGLTVACWAIASACLDDSITGTRPLTIDITVEPTTAAVDEVVTVRYVVTGTGLAGVIVDWGDGTVDSIPFIGSAVEAEGPVEHQYAAAGTYEILGTVEGVTGNLSDGTSVVVN